MTGWDACGNRITLTRAQEAAVRMFLEWDEGKPIALVAWPRGAGKSLVITTVARYARARQRGYLLRDDPLRGQRKLVNDEGHNLADDHPQLGGQDDQEPAADWP